ncbi:MAG: GNAT family N-acetyltransferase [Pseudomonadota bacterium]
MTHHFAASGTETLLDRPVWTALTSRLSHLSIANGMARSLPRDVSPLAAGANEMSKAVRDFDKMVAQREAPVITLERDAPRRKHHFAPVLELAGVQMVAKSIPPPKGLHAVETLDYADAPDMLKLAKATQPGPFEQRTHTLGDFIGIRRNGLLVAMAGQRLRLPGFTEISAVCVAPEYRSQGMAAELIGQMSELIRATGDTPFLHTYLDNISAIQLYEHLGFRIRTQMHIAKWQVPTSHQLEAAE